MGNGGECCSECKKKGEWALIWDLTDSPNRIYWRKLSEQLDEILVIGNQFTEIIQ